MYKEFSLSNGKAMMNFNAKYCNTSEELFHSEAFKRVLISYLKKIKGKNSEEYAFVKAKSKGQTKGTFKPLIEEDYEEEELCIDVINTFKLLLVFPACEIVNIDSHYEYLISEGKKCEKFIEGLYNYWRKLERYIVINNGKEQDGILNVSFVEAMDKFSSLIIGTYRKVEENLTGRKPNVYRQLPAGGNAGLTLSRVTWDCPPSYKELYDIPFINTIAIDTPFITYPQKNTRNGVFGESFTNLLEGMDINKEHFFCYPAKVSNQIAFIYFHRDFMAHGITLCNLFQLALEEEYKDKRPDLIFVFGARDKSKELITKFYEDKDNEITLGYISYSNEIDYFGYLKKMTLTLHNLAVIKKGMLPIHGAMVKITMKSGESANIVIMGDSGAGKSECLEAFRELGEEYISDMTVIFDDMGYVKYGTSGKPLAYGTEIGAFVRLDDLGPGYAFKEIDRSIFMNPDKINARLVIPITPYEEIIKGYPVDMFLYANNYETPSNNPISFFQSVEEALDTFVSGKRMAKGTTTECGLVESFFANPFGPVQRREMCLPMIEDCLSDMIDKGVKVGEIKTALGIVGMEKSGPTNAARELLQHLIK